MVADHETGRRTMHVKIPTAIIAANSDVVARLRSAHVSATAAELKDGAAGTKALVTAALESARQAATGADALGAGNVLDATFHRYVHHSVSDLTRAANLLDHPGRLGADARSLLTKALFDAEASTRLGTSMGERSLAKPSPRAIAQASSFAGGTDGAASRPAWIDGQWLDGSGNPVRGHGHGLAGPDGHRFDWDGSPFDEFGGGGSGTYVGPDGFSWSGI